MLAIIVITCAIIFEFYIGTIFMPYIYIFIFVILFLYITYNYLVYKKHMWLINNYQNDHENAILKIKHLQQANLFNRKNNDNYNEAIKIIEAMYESSI
jgi:energy-coupling factor transporter transmembrane protein EcfT